LRFDLPTSGRFDVLMPLMTLLHQPGRRVRVTQQMPHRDQSWATTLEGVITRSRQAKTGSWFAGARDGRLWLDRLELRLDDGEITVLNLDQYTVIEDVEPEGVGSSEEPGEAGRV
jgi:hypothetical protein